MLKKLWLNIFLEVEEAFRDLSCVHGLTENRKNRKTKNLICAKNTWLSLSNSSNKTQEVKVSNIFRGFQP